MASFTSFIGGDFVSGIPMRFVANPGQAFRFGSLDFLADALGELHLHDPVQHQLPGAIWASTSKAEMVLQSDPMLAQGISPIGQGSRLVGMIGSLLPVLEYSPSDDESSGSHHPSREAFVADALTGDGNDGLTTPIAEQTAEELEATRLRLIADQERLARQQVEFERLRAGQQRIEGMRYRGRQVHKTLAMREKDGVPLFPTPSYNVVAAAVAAQAIQIPEGTPGHDELRRLKILMDEAARHEL